MKIVFFHASAFNKAQFCELMDEAERLYRCGNEVYFATCHGLLNSCCSNGKANQGDCKACKLSSRISLRMLSSGIKRVQMDKYIPDSLSCKWDYSDANELKTVQYKNINLGYSVLSFYISLTRNLNPLISQDTKPFFDNLLTQGAVLAEGISKMIDEIKPDKLCVFNGRMFDAKPALLVGLGKGIRVDVYEIMLKYPYYKVVFENHLPHDIEYNTFLFDHVWDKSVKTIEEKRIIGKSFYEKRCAGIPAGDRVFILGQKQGLLPTDWDEQKTNIAIFNSSEDEYASIGDEYDRYRFFETQIGGIKEILEMTKTNGNIHFYLRVHPNLTGINYRYHQDLYDLPNQFSNITVIRADEPISTYSLMHAVEKVIVFGSTMGIESAYWGKPVILLAGANYYHLGACLIPKNREELLEMIIKPLNPPQISSDVFYKFGFYTMDTERAVSPTSFSFYDFNTFTARFLGKTFHGTNCQKILGSKKLYAWMFATLRQLLMRIYRDKYSIPLAEKID